MAVQSFQFKAIGPYRWHGRYKRIPGDTTTFKLKLDGNRRWWPCLEWDTEEGRLICYALGGNRHIESLVASVNEAKRRLSRTEGGSFMINECGQVLVPSSDGAEGKRMIVGETQGVLLFENPLSERPIDLSDTEGMVAGAAWERPYIGQVYNLHNDSSIYYYDEGQQKKQLPYVQDPKLVRSIRRFRRTGAVRFIVNPYGIVLTKIPVGDFTFNQEDEYTPIYIGKIDPRLWFIKEEDYEGI